MATLTMAIRTVGADEHVHFATVLVVDAAVLPGGPAATLFLQLRQVDSPNPNHSGTLTLTLTLTLTRSACVARRTTSDTLP